MLYKEVKHMSGDTSQAQIPSLSDIRKLRQEIAGRIANIPQNEKLKLADIKRWFNRVRSEKESEAETDESNSTSEKSRVETKSRSRREKLKFGQSSLRYLQEIQLVLPEKSEHGYYLYTWDDLQDILLIYELYIDYGLSFSQIGGLLFNEARDKPQGNKTSLRSSELPTSQNQVDRGILFWRSSLVNIMLQHLFNNSIPHSTFIFLSQNSHLQPRATRDTNSYWFDAKKCDYPDIAHLVRQPDYFLITTKEGETFHDRVNLNSNWNNYHRDHWYLIKSGFQPGQWAHQMIICVPGTYTYDLHQISDPQIKLLLTKLLAGCFLDLIERPSEKFETQLEVLVNLIPEMSSKWEYSACLTPGIRHPNLLSLTAKSQHFPLWSEDQTQIASGLPLSGLAFQQNRPIAVQKTIGKEDPRVSEESTSAAIAVPTSINNQPNGVIYVASRYHATVEEEIFTEDEILLLQIIGQLVGRLIETERIRKQANQSAIGIIKTPTFEVDSWEVFQTRISEIIAVIVAEKSEFLENDNLHFAAVRISNYNELSKRSREVARWVQNQLYLIARNYYIVHNLGQPLLYKRSDDKFVVLIERVALDDDEERKLRDELRDDLNSLQLSFGRRDNFEVKCELWSLPFRYLYLRQLADQQKTDGLQSATQQIIENTEQAFSILPYIYLAHEYEEEGNLLKELEQYRLAHTVAPSNVYIWRHLAKTLTKLEKYQEAERWWLRIVTEQQHPSHYRRLAYNQACLGEIPSALRSCEKAISLMQQEAKTYQEWGNILLADKQIKEAIEKFEQAAALDTVNRAVYQLRIAEAHYLGGNYADASNACALAYTHDPNNEEIPFWSLKIAQAEAKAKTAGRNTIKT
jgi:tetratricopeptide (TPR) repeat protein/DNA-binding transcriptional MerR regulator